MSHTLIWVDHEAPELLFIWDWCRLERVEIKLCSTIREAHDALAGYPKAKVPNTCLLLDAHVIKGWNQPHNEEEASMQNGVGPRVSGHLTLANRDTRALWSPQTIVLSLFPKAMLTGKGFDANWVYHRKEDMPEKAKRHLFFEDIKAKVRL